MSRAEEFHDKLMKDELLNEYTGELDRCKRELVLATVNVYNRAMEIYPEGEEKPSAQVMLAEMNENLMMEICIRAIDIINPTWKEETMALMANDELDEMYKEVSNLRATDIKLH